MPIPSQPEAASSAALPGLGAAVDELVAYFDSDAQIGADGLLSTLAEVTTAIGRLQAVQMLLAEQVEATDTVATTGWASTKDLLTHLTGGRKGTGGGILRLAEQTSTLPQVRAGMLAGDLSPAQARTIARRVTTLPADPVLRIEAARLMVDQAHHESLDATDLDRAFISIITTLDPDGTLLTEERHRPARERGAHHARHLALTPDEVGGVTITGYAGLEDAELIRTTLAPLAAPVTTTPGACGGDPTVDWLETARRRYTGQPHPQCPTPGCRHDGHDPRDHGARLLDALVETCRRLQAIDHGPGALPRDHGATARITVTIDHHALTDQLTDKPGTGVLGSGQRLSAAAVRRLACDAEILPAVLGTPSQILDLGRTQRLVTPALWLAVVARDQHCVFPGCTRPPHACEAHHLTHWADGGATSLDNLALLCRHHHTLTHHSPWTIALDAVTRRPTWTPPPPSPTQPYTARFGPPGQSHPPPTRLTASA